nr:PTS sugar transporter subunit IIA [Lacticaseibacillus chiayiensis]
MNLNEVNVTTDVHTDVEIPADKHKALRKIATILSTNRSISADELGTNLIAREDESSTGFGNGVAIPHAKVNGLTEPFVGVVTFNQPVAWDSLDGQPVSIAIVLVMPDQNGADKLHLKMLSKLARKLMDDDFIKALKDAQHDGAQMTKVLDQVL